MDLQSWGKSLPPSNPNLQYEESLVLPTNSFASDGTELQNELPPSGYISMTAASSGVLDDYSIWQSDDLYSLDRVFWGFDRFDSTYSHVDLTDSTGTSFPPPGTRSTDPFNAMPSPGPSERGQSTIAKGFGTNQCNTFSHPTPDATMSLTFPLPGPEDFEIIQREDSGHVHSISSTAYDKLRAFLNNYVDSKSSHVPPVEFFHSFVQLYFEYFDPLFPFIHPSVLGEDNLPWVLLLAVSAIGCQYSGVDGGAATSTVLHEVLKRAIICEMPDPLQTVSLPFVQSMFLRDVRMLFCGSKRQQLKLQYERNSLVTLYRSFAAGREAVSQHSSSAQDSYQDWQSWLDGESMTRLLCSIFYLDFLQMILLDLQPMCSMRDLAVHNLKDDKLWDCQEAPSWKAELESRKDHSDSSRQSNHTLPPSIFQRVPIMALYVQERIALDNMNILSRPASSLLPRLTGNIPIPVASLQMLATPLSTAIDSEFHISKFVSDTDPLFHITSILRKVPLRRLHSFSGWQAHTSEIEESEKSLEAWMQANEEPARECLWHAAVVFSTLRGQSYLSCHAPLCILIAAIYIWAYDKLSRHNIPKVDNRSSISTVRIDCLQDPTRIERWIKGESGITRIHIKQVGILNGSDSISRLLLELERVFLAQTAWSGLCGGLAFAVRRIIEGGHPSFQPE
ncbi:hypothetical protein BKA64DRAFT_710017 [Cadophora sp. MPI-SDFR-AT-0126]|nr:hypothetical protein BKA64DRAFT_710017 [Leotiomycetes sp. MPI-SDFR-AT-0126]